MIIEVVKEKTYIPEWNGNREQPDSDQIRVVHGFLTYGDRNALVRKTETTYVVGDDGEAKPAFTVKTDHRAVVRKMVRRIENLAVSVDGNIKEIKTADDFWNCDELPPALSREILEYLVDATPEIDTDPT
jgi:hypothetical protein